MHFHHSTEPCKKIKLNRSEKCLSSCIERACNDLGRLRIGSVHSRRISDMIVYPIYMEDIPTGRMWVVVRLYSEIGQLRDFLHHLLKEILHQEKKEKNLKCESGQLLKSIIKKIISLHFPGKLVFRHEESIRKERAEQLTIYFQELLQLLDKQLITPAMISSYSNFTRHSLKDAMKAVKSFLGAKCTDSPIHLEYVCPCPISKRCRDISQVLVSKCGDLDTVVEAPEDCEDTFLMN